MPRWSAHLGYLYTEVPLAQRMEAAARDGFTAVEHPAPFEVPASEMKARLGDLGLTFSQITSGMGDMAAGEKGLAALRGREHDFREGLARAIDYAQVVDCPYIHPMAGVPIETGLETYDASIALTLDLAEKAGMRVLVEAITIPGYAIGTLDDAIALQDRFHGRLDLLLDSYHARVLGVDAPAWIGSHGRRIGHVHVADHPGRHEPGTGILDLEGFLKALMAHGYAGAIGFEYIPSGATSESTRFLSNWKADIHGGRI